MNSNQYRWCLEITKKLQKHPAAKPFLKPVNPADPGFEDYYNFIDDPQDLTTIETKLKEKYYRSVREWKRDINTIWSNAVTYSGTQSFGAILANHMQSVFEKELKIMSTTNLPGWLSKVCELKNEFIKAFENSPESLHESAPLDMIERKSLTPLMPDDYTFILKSLSTLPNQNDRDKLSKIIGKAESEIDLTKLPLSTLHEAQEFIKLKSSDTRRSLFDIKPDEMLA